MRTDLALRPAALFSGIIALLLFAAVPRTPLLLYNRTPSLPIGWYVRCDDRLHPGDIVAFALPSPAWSYAQRRGDSTHMLLLKHVLAMRGDFVSTLHHQLRVNGVLVGSIAAADPAGHSLPQWTAKRLLVGDELLVGSMQLRSFDSRYFGPIHASQVIGVYRRLTSPFSFLHSIKSDSLRDSFSIRQPPPIFDRSLGGDANAESKGVKGKCRN